MFVIYKKVHSEREYACEAATGGIFWDHQIKLAKIYSFPEVEAFIKEGKRRGVVYKYLEM